MGTNMHARISAYPAAVKPRVRRRDVCVYYLHFSPGCSSLSLNMLRNRRRLRPPFAAVRAISFRLSVYCFSRDVEGPRKARKANVERRNAELTCLGVERAAVYGAGRLLGFRQLRSQYGLLLFLFLFFMLPAWCLPRRRSGERCCFVARVLAAAHGGSGVSWTGNTSLTGNSRGCCRRGKLLPYGPPRSTENTAACLPAVVIRIARWHEPTATLFASRSHALSL